MAMATYTAQNYGARKYDRIQSGIKSSLLIQYVYCLVSWLAIFCTKTGLVSLVLGESSSPTAVKALEYLTRISVLFAIHCS